MTDNLENNIIALVSAIFFYRYWIKEWLRTRNKHSCENHLSELRLNQTKIYRISFRTDEQRFDEHLMKRTIFIWTAHQ